MGQTDAFRAARDLLQRHRTDYESAVAEFRWPELTLFNFGFDWFDLLAAEAPDVPALWIVHADGTEDRLTYGELAARSSQVAAWLRAEGVDRGDRVLLVLGNVVPLWEVMLACIKLGAVVIPATTLLGPRDLADRVERGKVRHVVAASADTEKFADLPGDWTRIAVGPPVAGWLRYDDSVAHLESFQPEVDDRRRDGIRREPAAVRRRRPARHDGPLRGDDVLRAADGVADAGAGRPAQPPGAVAAGGRRRRRAAQPRGHRAGAAGVGHDRARRVRPDRDDRADRQPARRAAQAGLDGPAAAGLHRRVARPDHVRGRCRGRDLPRPLGSAGGADGRLPRRPAPHRRGHAGRVLPHR